MKKSIKQRFITSALFLLLSTVVVKVISAVYKIPLTTYIGATGRGYFSIAYNYCMPVHALTMGAFPIALTKLVSTYDAQGNVHRIKSLRKASEKLFLIIGILGTIILFIGAKPYTHIIASSSKAVFTIFALAPSVFFSCLCACHRAFAEGFLDMKATAISQMLEASFKMVFGLLFARLSMSCLYGTYLEHNTVMGIVMIEEEALTAIYPLTSACSMLGVTLGSIASWLFASFYTRIRYNAYSDKITDTKDAYNELLSFSAPLVAATVIQSLSNFADTSSIQYCLSLCDKNVLISQYSAVGEDVYTYVFGLYASALDFKNLIPAIVMALGVTAVPAVSSAYESDSARFSSLLTSIFKYSSILSVGGGVVLSLFSSDILSIFYGKSHPDIVSGAGALMFVFGITSLPAACASTSVFCANSLGYAKKTILPFSVSAVVRIILNFILVGNSRINILGTAFSNFFGFMIILVWNMIIIKKYTNAKYSLNEIFAKPVICAALTYYITLSVRNTLFANTSFMFSFLLSLTICLLLFAFFLFILNCISAKEVKLLK